MDNSNNQASQLIRLSTYTDALIKNFLFIKQRVKVDEISRINVSRTVSFFALLYEKVRNAVEYREEHLIRRAAIERILKRRLMLNPEGKSEAENLIRELLWARYFATDSVGLPDVEIIQNLIDKFIKIRKTLLVGQTEDKKIKYSQFLFDLLTCEIEETLAINQAKKISLFTFYIFQVLKNKIKIEKVDEVHRDAYFYVAIEKGFSKNDNAYIRYHIFNLFNKPLSELTDNELQNLTPGLGKILDRIDSIIINPYVDRLVKYVRNQMASFNVLFLVIQSNVHRLKEVLANKQKLWPEIDRICREKYQQSSTRLRNLAIRSLIYIFLTKMIFALILEYPLSKYLYGDVNYFSIIINSFFPPLLMLFIIGFVKIPGEDNTKRIFERVINIIDADKSFETSIAYIVKKPKTRKPLLIFGFTVFYSLTFLITLALIHTILLLLNFNIISEIIFIFFVSIVSFFAYRVKQVAREYVLKEKEGFFAPFIDFFFMPILSIGKFFSSEIARLNFFIVIFDFLIEAPFKLIFEIIEEWISFVRARKEEII